MSMAHVQGVFAMSQALVSAFRNISIHFVSPRSQETAGTVCNRHRTAVARHLAGAGVAELERVSAESAGCMALAGYP